MPKLVTTLYVIEVVGADTEKAYVVEECDLETGEKHGRILVIEWSRDGKPRAYGPFPMTQFELVVDRETNKVEIRRVRL